MIKFVSRDEMCIMDQKNYNDRAVTWALSKGFERIYIMEHEEVTGIALVTSFQYCNNVIVKTTYNQINGDEHSMEEATNQIENGKENFLPVFKENRIIGEFVKENQVNEKIRLQWNLIDKNLLKEYFNHIQGEIFFALLDEHTRGLYEILVRWIPHRVHIWNIEEQEIIEDDNLFIYYVQHGGLKEKIKEKYCYITIETIYAELLLRTILAFYVAHQIQYIFVPIPTNHELPSYIKKNLYNHKVNWLSIDRKARDFYYGDNRNRAFWETRDYQKVVIIKKGDRYCLKDAVGETYNVMDGKRYTKGNPDQIINSIHCHGPCIVRGSAVIDECTIPSILQKRINEETDNKVCVVNNGLGGTTNVVAYLYNMYYESYREKDIVIQFDLARVMDKIIQKIGKSYPIKVLNIIEQFNEENTKQPCFIDMFLHCTHRANEVIANYLFEVLQDRIKQMTGENTKKIQLAKDLGINDWSEIKLQLTEYKKSLELVRDNTIEGSRNGSIVMNCNPFTKGHMYLIEKSLEYVDRLYIFVVEEDRSFFSFQERMEMVKKNCEGIEKIKVLPSGKFIISALTFPEYFFKEEEKEAIINPNQDIELFGAEIAPVLNITMRFVGEEPFDKVTRQYNQLLHKGLEKYGIQVIEIPRKMKDEIPISATRVRQLLKEGNVEKTRELVTEATYKRLQCKYKN